MKNLISLLTILIFLPVNSQIKLKYKLFSKIWTVEITDKSVILNPISESGFNFKKTDSIRNSLDTNKIKKYLSESFIQFRKDYGKSSVKISDSISNECEKYSRTLFENYAHAKFFGNNSCECINKALLCLFTTVKKSDGDINKIVADGIFDTFFISNNHMDYLLSEAYNTYGIGVTFRKYSIDVVVRGSSLK